MCSITVLLRDKAQTTNDNNIILIPETVAMVEFAICQKPLHKVDVFVTGSAGTAERAVFGHRTHFTMCLHWVAWLFNVTTVWFLGRGQGVGGEMTINEEGFDRTRSQIARCGLVIVLNELRLRLLYPHVLMDSPRSLHNLDKRKIY